MLDASSTLVDSMRYALQFLVPALVVIIVALVLFRNRGTTSQRSGPVAQDAPPTDGLSTGAIVLILIVAAAFTVALVYGLQGFG